MILLSHIYVLFILHFCFIDNLTIISVIPDNLLIAEGKTAQFNIRTYSIAAVRYQWHKRGINALPEKVLGTNTSVLIIPNLNKSDGGQYYCVVTNKWNRSEQSDDVILTVYGMLVDTTFIPCTTFN